MQVTLEKGTVLEVHLLADPVRKRLLGRFAYKFEIEMEFFWHPEKVL